MELFTALKLTEVNGIAAADLLSPGYVDRRHSRRPVSTGSRYETQVKI